MAPKVSVLMPAYNAEKYIAEAIESILSQTFKDFEFIIIDDASTDNTWKLIKQHAKKDKRIRAYRNEKNLNIAGTLNKGIKLAKSEIIARMDADDISLPARLSEQYKYLTDHKNVAVIGGDIILIDEDGNTLHKRTYEHNSKKMKKNIFRYLPFAHPTTMYRKNVVEEFGLYDKSKSPSEDMDLWIKIGTKHDFGSISKPIFKYRTFLKSSSNKKLRWVEINTIKMRFFAATKYGYMPSFTDIIYNLIQLATVYIMPAKTRVDLFNYLRSKNLI